MPYDWDFWDWPGLVPRSECVVRLGTVLMRAIRYVDRNRDEEFPVGLVPEMHSEFRDMVVKVSLSSEAVVPTERSAHECWEQS